MSRKLSWGTLWNYDDLLETKTRGATDFWIFAEHPQWLLHLHGGTIWNATMRSKKKCLEHKESQRSSVTHTKDLFETFSLSEGQSYFWLLLEVETNILKHIRNKLWFLMTLTLNWLLLSESIASLGILCKKSMEIQLQQNGWWPLNPEESVTVKMEQFPGTKTQQHKMTCTILCTFCIL